MQTELFEMTTRGSATEVGTETKTNILEKKILTLRFDQMIGLILVTIVLYVISFSWGYEKGKHSIQNAKIVTRIAPEVQPQPLPKDLTVFEEVPAVLPETATVASVTQSASSARETEVTVTQPTIPASTRPTGKYTIQHVIYKTQSAADREIQALTKKGQQAFIIPSGKYLQVCVAGFQTKKEADHQLRQLRAQRIISGDAYVRPLPS